MTMNRCLITMLCALACTSALAQSTEVPTTDAAGASDPAGVQRFQGAVLLRREDADYDELDLPSAALKNGRTADDSIDLNVLKASASLPVAGRRTRLMYVLPAQRSGLELIRNYQAQLGSQGFSTVFECAAEQCGDAIDAYVSSYPTFANALYPKAQWPESESSPPACAAALRIKDVRYALLKNAQQGGVVALFTHSPDITSAFCDEPAWQARSIATVVLVQPKGIAQTMVTVDADQMSKAISETGRVALYGILFDTDKDVLKPQSKAALEQIAKLLTQQPQLNLHVVGHTDAQGTLEANFDLSRRRALAVQAALIRDYGIAASRLTGNGVSSLAPVASNSTDEGRAKNRRVELVPF